MVVGAERRYQHVDSLERRFLIGNRDRETRTVSRMRNKICIVTLICGGIAEILTFYRKSGSRYAMATSYFRPDVEMLPFSHFELVWLGGHHVPENVFLLFFRYPML